MYDPEYVRGTFPRKTLATVTLVLLPCQCGCAEVQAGLVKHSVNSWLSVFIMYSNEGMLLLLATFMGLNTLRFALLSLLPRLPFRF